MNITIGIRLNAFFKRWKMKNDAVYKIIQMIYIVKKILRRSNISVFK